MKITSCIRCGTWFHNGLRVKSIEKVAAETLVKGNLLTLEVSNIVCNYCRAGIGNEMSEKLLKMFNDDAN